MSRRPKHVLKNPAPTRHNGVVRAVSSRRSQLTGRRARLDLDVRRGGYMPPEAWYEPTGELEDYVVLEQPAGNGFRHVLTEEEIRARLAQLPAEMTQGLEVVQLSQMTRKKRRAPCYGMQWGATIYLYPVEESRIEVFTAPPKPAQKIEAAMYGAQWEPLGRGRWRLVWSEETLKDFYLNNVLIHELGHLLDQRNTTSKDRERYAEWFALEHGYKASRRERMAADALAKMVVRRHHK